MSTPIRLATVGAGYFSRFQYAAWARIPEVEVVALCNRDPGHAREVAEQYQIGEVFEDFVAMLDQVKPDLVDIITPPITHESYVMACVERGIPVICQKPFTPSRATAEALVQRIQAQQATVIIHENFRFQPWYCKIRELLLNGIVGEVYQVYFALRPGDGQGPEAYLERQPYFQQMPRFLVHETAIHLIDVFRYLFGEISSVYADLRRVNPVIQGEDAGYLLFQFANGSRGVFDGNRLSDHQARNRRLTMGEMTIEGAKGTLTLNGDAGLAFRAHGSNQQETIHYAWRDCDFGGDCVYRLQRHVIDHLLLGSELMNTAQEYLTNIIIADTAYTASEQRTCLDVVTPKTEQKG